MNNWKYSLVSQFVSNVVLFSLAVKTRSLVLLLTITPVVLFLFKQVSNPIRIHVHLKSSWINSMGSSFLARHNTTDSRHQCSCCQRSATMFAVFLHCTAVLNCVRATHGLPADRAPVYRGCPCQDPLGCPLIPRQDGIRDKAPTLWLLPCCCNC